MDLHWQQLIYCGDVFPHLSCWFALPPIVINERSLNVGFVRRLQFCHWGETEIELHIIIIPQQHKISGIYQCRMSVYLDESCQKCGILLKPGFVPICLQMLEMTSRGRKTQAFQGLSGMLRPGNHPERNNTSTKYMKVSEFPVAIVNTFWTQLVLAQKGPMLTPFTIWWSDFVYGILNLFNKRITGGWVGQNRASERLRPKKKNITVKSRKHDQFFATSVHSALCHERM